MGFKLGSSIPNIANQGEVSSKLSFKNDASIPGVPVIRKKLGKGIMGEANNDGSIFISDKIMAGSKEEDHVLAHEMVHLTDMKVGKLAYSDDHIKWQGNTYERKNGMINYEGKMMPEGSKDFPWEKMPWE